MTRTDDGVPRTTAAGGGAEIANPTLAALGVPDGVPLATGDQVPFAKPDLDLFPAAAERVGVGAAAAAVVGDGFWDLLAERQARALRVGLLSGGYARAELETAGAYRAYEDRADLLRHLDEVGVRTAV